MMSDQDQADPARAAAPTDAEGDVGIAGTAFDDAVKELVDAGIAVEFDPRTAEVDPIGAEWERVTRAVLAIHVDWSRRERQAIEDFILTVRHSISEVPPPSQSDAARER